ncbi:MAG: DUF4836 family protein [Pseudoflavonifractor sp.]|nr:DUF4836 family protein [Pseudoflavonifractor sp.]
MKRIYSYICSGCVVAIVALTVMLSLVGCSSDSSLLSTVPADATAVARVDAVSLLKEAGCAVDGDKVTLTPALDSLLSGRVADGLKAVLGSGAVDLRSVLAFSPTGVGMVVVVRLTDSDDFRDVVSSHGAAWSAAGDFSFANLPDGLSLLVRDDICWLLDGGRDESYLDGILSKAADKSMADVPAVAKALGKDNAFCLALPAGKLLAPLYDAPEYQDCWLTAALKADGKRLDVEAGLVTAEGKTLDYASGLDKIDTDFLDFLSPQDVLVAAVGIDGDTNWPAVVTALSSRMSRGDAMTLSVLTPYLSRIDGTLAVGVSPVGSTITPGNLSTETLAITVVARMKRGEASKTCKEITEFLSRSRMPMTEDGGMTVAVTPMGTFRYGEHDGYIVVTNRELPGNGARGLQPRFDGKRLAICADVAYGSGLMTSFGLPFGLTSTLSSTDKSARLSVELAGVGGNVLEVLIAEAAKNMSR